MAQKAQLRARLKDVVKHLDPLQRARKDMAISERLKACLNDRFSASQNRQLIIGVYAPLKDEVSWYQTSFEHFNLAFPARNGASSENMSFYPAKYHELTESSEFGALIRVPASGREPVAPSIVVVPGLAFSTKGFRLGRGKGYYDKYLEHYKGPTIGVCYEEQIVDNIPTQVHDCPVGLLITEDRLIDCQMERKAGPSGGSK